MAVPVIYLSAAQADLRTHRMAARAILEAEGLQVVDYEIRDATGWSPVRHGMRTSLRGCHAMVHLAGTCFGAEPNAVPAGAVRRSYAQMEYHLASDLHIPCYSIVLAQDFPFDPHPPEDEEARMLQAQHREMLTQGMSSMDTVHDPGDLQWSLEALASRIRMSHAPTASKPKAGAASGWLALTLLSTVCVAGAAYFFVRHPLGSRQAAQVPSASVPSGPVLDAASMERGRRMIAELAAAAVIAGFPSEQQDPITKVELGLDELARREGITALEARLDLQRFANAADASPGSSAADKALAAFALGKHKAASSLLPDPQQGSDDAQTDVGARDGLAGASSALLLKGHFQYLAGEHTAALISYKAALQTIDRTQSPGEWLRTAHIAAVAMTNLAQWEEASQLLTDALIHIDTQPQIEPLIHAHTLQAMASLEVARGQAGTAEGHLRKACKLLEASGAEHQQELAMITVSLAEALCFAGKRDGAEEAFRRAVVMQEQLHGPDSPEAARVLGCLATMLSDSGRQAHGLALCQRALAINEKRFSPAHPRVARDLMRMAAITSQTPSDPRDVEFCRRALDICTKAFGDKHPASATAMISLAMALGDHPNSAEPESLAHEAVSIDVGAFGEDHPLALRDMKVLARAFKTTGNKDEALNLHRRVVSICERKFGPANAETARALTVLAQALTEDGGFADAEPLYRRALSIFEKQFGPDDFRVFLTARNLADVLRHSGNKEQALELYRRALEIAKRNLPPDDAGLFVELSNVGGALRSLGRYADAEAVFREALAIQEKSLSPSDPLVAETLSNLAGVLFLSGRHSDAEPVYRRVLETLAAASRERRQPHPNLELARKNYHADLKRMGLSEDEISKRIEKVEAGEAVKDLTAVSVK
jgi:tetratricopeptide (TPR) repeat protein